MPAMSEEQIVEQITEMLQHNEAKVFRSIERVPHCYRCNLYLGSSEEGKPDLDGYFSRGGEILLPFWFEVKRPKAKRRPKQIERINMIREDGGCAAIVESWADVIKAIERHGLTVRVK